MGLSHESKKYLDSLYVYLEDIDYISNSSNTRRRIIKLLNYKLNKYNNKYKQKDNHKMLIKYKK